jgi:signal peptidase I
MRFVVHGHSMEPTYFEEDRLFVSSLIYRIFKPKKGDVVVVQDSRTGRLILKRIVKIRGSKYFVVGDNPSKSTDSRQFGTVARSAIIGKVLFRYATSSFPLAPESH